MGNATGQLGPVWNQGIGNIGDILAKRQQMVQQRQMQDKHKYLGSSGSPVGGPYVGSPKISDQVGAPPQNIVGAPPQSDMVNWEYNQSQQARPQQQFSGFNPFGAVAFGGQGSPNYGPFNGGQLPAQRPANLAPGMQFMDGGQPKPQAPSRQVPQGAGTTLRRFTNQQPANSFSPGINSQINQLQQARRTR